MSNISPNRSIDFADLFDKVSTEIATKYTLIGREYELDFLYHFVVCAFFVPKNNVIQEKTLTLVESLIAQAIIVNYMKKNGTSMFCGAEINLYTFCPFWGSVMEKSESIFQKDQNALWGKNLADIIKFAGAAYSGKSVYTSFLDPFVFEEIFPEISKFRFNLLVQPNCPENILSNHSTLGTFFKFSKIYETSSCAYFVHWKIDFSNHFHVADGYCSQQSFRDLLREEKNWPTNTWYRCAKCFPGIDNFCFVTLISKY